MAYQSMDEIIDINVGLEERFVWFLKHVRPKFRDEQSKHMLQTLLSRTREDLLKLEKVKENYRERKEFVKNVPHVRIEDTIPCIDQEKSWSAQKLFEQILNYEDTHLKFYQQLFAVVSFEHSRDICESMIKFKVEQIKWITALERDHELSF